MLLYNGTDCKESTANRTYAALAYSVWFKHYSIH